MRVLIVKTSSMGDVLHTLPSLTDAMREIPSIRFDWVVEKDFSQIPTWHEAVDRVIPIAIRHWRKAWFSAPVKAERKAFRKAVRMQRYDLVIDAQGLIKSAVMVTRLAYSVKHGMNWHTAREPLASLFYNHRHHIKKQQHAVEYTRELFAKSLNYLRPKSQGDYAISQHFIHNITPNGASYVIFLHATTRDDKHWPETNWRILIKLMQSNGVHIKLPWWSEHEHQRAKRLAAGFTHVEVLPKLSLEQVAKKLVEAKVIISVDTGLSHLTAALDKPNITLFGPTDPSLIGGYGKNQYQVVSPTKKMRDITADEIFALLQDNHMLTDSHI